uniref:centrosomal protein of 290 kDa isoform X3 n=1 Tax=Myxine glutinosa TaxID=7769 RepID=UPI00358E731A
MPVLHQPQYRHQLLPIHEDLAGTSNLHHQVNPQAMSPKLDWEFLMRLDPATLEQHENDMLQLLDVIPQITKQELQGEHSKNILQLFFVTQFLLQLKVQESAMALEELEKAGEEQAHTEEKLKANIERLKKELEHSHVASIGGRHVNMMREEMCEMEQRLERRESELHELEQQLEHQKEFVEQLTHRAEEAENSNSKLRKENENLRQDILGYQQQMDSQHERQKWRHNDDSVYKSQVSRLNRDVMQYLDEMQVLTETNERLEKQGTELRQKLEQATHEMERASDEYAKMKAVVEQSDLIADELRKDKEELQLQVQQINALVHARDENNDPVMKMVNSKVEEWKQVFKAKDEAVLQYQQELAEVREHLQIAQLDSDRTSILVLQQALQERDHQVEVLTDQVVQGTQELNQNSILIEEFHSQLDQNLGEPEGKLRQLQVSLSRLNERAAEAEKETRRVECDAQAKDEMINNLLTCLRNYEAGHYGLPEALRELQECRGQLERRERDMAKLTQNVNETQLQLDDFMEENEGLRQRLGLEPKEMVDLTGFRKNKVLNRQRCLAENQALHKQIEQLEEEKLELKRRFDGPVDERAQHSQVEDPSQIGMREGPSASSPAREQHWQKEPREMQSLSDVLKQRDRQLYVLGQESTQLQQKVNNLQQENGMFEVAMQDILQAIRDTHTSADTTEVVLKIPSLEQLVTAMELTSTQGPYDVALHMKMQVAELSGRNEELRRELDMYREEAKQVQQQLNSALEKVSPLEAEAQLFRGMTRETKLFPGLDLPEDLSSSSTDTFGALNMYLIQLLQENKDQEENLEKMDKSLEEYKRKFSLVRHQQGLLYKEYNSEREEWQSELARLERDKQALEMKKEEGEVKVDEYERLLESLRIEPEDLRCTLAEMSGRIAALQVEGRVQARQITALLENEGLLCRQNKRLQDQLVQAEVAVTQRIGYLQRYKDEASRRLTTLQRELDQSVPAQKLKEAKVQHAQLTAKYRDVLQRESRQSERDSELGQLQGENTALKEGLETLKQELELAKEKIHCLNQSHQEVNHAEVELSSDNVGISGAQASFSRQLAVLEMKELNERERANHAQRFTQQLQALLQELDARNHELEEKFARLTKINLEAQDVERGLRDELAGCVSRSNAEAMRLRLANMEESETVIKTQLSKQRELADVAIMQAKELHDRRQIKEKCLELLRQQLLELQSQSDERALIGRLQQRIAALLVDEASAAQWLEKCTMQLKGLEAQNLRLEQRVDDLHNQLLEARVEGRRHVGALRAALQAERDRFAGAVPLVELELLVRDLRGLREQRNEAENNLEKARREKHAAEDLRAQVELKNHGLEELMEKLKDDRRSITLVGYHGKVHEARLRELQQHREAVRHKEQVEHLRALLVEQEGAVAALESEIVHLNKVHEERELSWEQREVELERQLEAYEKQQQEVLGTARQFEEVMGRLPDSNLPLAQQLEQVLQQVWQHVHAIAEAQTISKLLEQRLKNKDEALRKAEAGLLSRDRLVNELRMRLPASVESSTQVQGAAVTVQASQEERVAVQELTVLRSRLQHKEQLLAKYQHLLQREREDHEAERQQQATHTAALQHQLDTQADAAFSRFQETVQNFMQKIPGPSTSIEPTSRLSELQTALAAREETAVGLSEELKVARACAEHELEQAREEAELVNRQLEQHHTAELERLERRARTSESELAIREKELKLLQEQQQQQHEVPIQEEAARVHTLVEQLKKQLTIKEKQQKALSKAVLELRGELTRQAEQAVVAAAREENHSVQQLLDKHTHRLEECLSESREHVRAQQDELNAVRLRESNAWQENERLRKQLARAERDLSRLQDEGKRATLQRDELRRKLIRLQKATEVVTQSRPDEMSREAIHLEEKLANSKAARKDGDESIKSDKRAVPDAVASWEEGKRWQNKLESLRSVLKEKENEVEKLKKQVSTLKGLLGRAEQEKVSLQRRLRGKGLSAEPVRQRVKVQKSDHLKSGQTSTQDVQKVEIESEQQQERKLRVENLPSKINPRTDELRNQVLKLSAETVSLQFEIEQARMELPQLKDENKDLKEMCQLLMKEKKDLQKKLTTLKAVDGSQSSGKKSQSDPKTLGRKRLTVEQPERDHNT